MKRETLFFFSLSCSNSHGGHPAFTHFNVFQTPQSSQAGIKLFNCVVITQYIYLCRQINDNKCPSVLTFKFTSQCCDILQNTAKLHVERWTIFWNISLPFLNLFSLVVLFWFICMSTSVIRSLLVKNRLSVLCHRYKSRCTPISIFSKVKFVSSMITTCHCFLKMFWENIKGPAHEMLWISKKCLCNFLKSLIY